MKRTALLLIFLAVMTRMVGFGREVILSAYYGVSSVSDAYIVSRTIPLMIAAFIGRGISTGYIPLYSKIKNDLGEERANRFTVNLVNVTAVIGIGVALLGIVNARWIVHLFALGFTDETLSLSTRFTQISLAGVVFSSVIFVFQPFLQIKNNYLIPALIGLPLNVVMILSIILSSRGSVMILAYGLLFSAAAQLIFLVPFVYRKGLELRLGITLKDKYLKEMIALALPVIIGLAVHDVNTIVDKTLASRIVEGGISALNYAHRLSGFVQGIVVLSFATAMYPVISKMAVRQDLKGLKRTLQDAVNGVNILLVPATVGFMVLARPIVEVLFERGAFDARAVLMTSNMLFYYALGLGGVGLRTILSRPFYACQDTRTPVINAAAGVVLNIILNLVLSHYMGLSGLALATSIAAFFTAGMMLVSLRRRIGSLGEKQMGVSFLKILGASLVMGAAARLTHDFLSSFLGRYSALAAAIVIALGVYAAAIYLLHLDSVESLISLIKKRFDQSGK